MMRVLFILLASAMAVAASGTGYGAVGGHTVYVKLLIDNTQEDLVLTCQDTAPAGIWDAPVPGSRAVREICGEVLVSPPEATGPWLATGALSVVDGLVRTEVISPGPAGPVIGHVIPVPRDGVLNVAANPQDQVQTWPGLVSA